MEKGQHLRLLITDSNQKNVVALAKNLSANFSAQTEASTTKDTSDGSGVVWDEFDVTMRSVEIQFSGLVGVGEDPYVAPDTSADPPVAEQIGGLSFADWISKFGNTLINWKLVMVNGDKNRVIGKTVCSGQGKLQNLQAQATAGQATTPYNGTLKAYGSVAVGSD